jgi:hypothetical protein
MICLPNIRMESIENIKLHPKIALGAISDCVGFFSSRSHCTLVLIRSCAGGTEHV